MRNLLICSLFLTGCLSERKLAETCAEKFPVKEQIKEVLIIDTVQSLPDTVVVHFKDSNFTFVCPPSKTITLTKEVTKVQENTARIKSMQIAYQKQMESLHLDYQKHEENHLKEVEKLKKDLNNIQEKYKNVKKFKLWFYLLISGLVIIFAIRNRWLRLPL
jgi:alkyl hydroperoxide reductase subunit AhpC